MTLEFDFGGLDVSDYVALEGSIQVTSAADGSVATGTLTVEDPDGTLALENIRYFTINETACSQPRIFTGYSYSNTTSRGPYRTGPGRIWTIEFGDLNFLLHLQPLRGASAKRPSETRTERMDYLLAAATGLDGIVFDNGLVNTDGAIMEEDDLRTKYPDEVLSDLCITSRMSFVYWDPSAAEASLFFNLPTAAIRDSTLRISNVLSDVDESTTFEPYLDASLEGAGEGLYCGVDYIFRTGRIYRHDATTHALLFPSEPDMHRVAVVNNDRVGSTSAANTRALQFLANSAANVETITVTVRLPRDKVNLIDAGMRLPVRFSHLPGWDGAGFTYVRVSRRTVTLTAGTNKFYDLQLELTNRALFGSAGGGGSGGGGGSPGPGGFPHQPACEPGWDTVPTVDGAAGGLLTVTQPNGSSGAQSTDSFLLYDGCTYTLVAHLEPHHDDAIHLVVEGGLIQALGAPVGTSITPGNTPSPVHASDVGGPPDVLDWTAGAIATVGSGGPHPGSSAHFVAFTYSYAYVDANGGGTVLTVGATYVSGPDPRFEDLAVICADPTDNPPSPGQWVYDEVPTGTVDGSNTDFTNVHSAYATGSLHAAMNGSELDAGVDFTETSPAAGTLAFTRPPPANAQLIIWYQGR